MSKDNLAIAEAYYTEVGKKNIAYIEKYLHADVEFTGPLSKMRGKEGVMEATKHFANILTSLKIRAKLSSENQTMLVYDIDTPIAGHTSGASLMTFKDGFITKIELFYDPRPFEQKKDEIFSK